MALLQDLIQQIDDPALMNNRSKLVYRSTENPNETQLKPNEKPKKTVRFFRKATLTQQKRKKPNRNRNRNRNRNTHIKKAPKMGAVCVFIQQNKKLLIIAIKMNDRSKLVYRSTKSKIDRLKGGRETIRL